MGISDSVPERRNLVVLSVVIILYYAGGGTVVGSDLKLPMVNVEFTRLWVLALSVWVALLWFYFRYWQTWREEGRDQIKEDIKSFSNAPCVHSYVVDNAEVSPGQRERFIVRGIVFAKPKKEIHYDKRITHKTEGQNLKKLHREENYNGVSIDITGPTGQILVAKLYLKALFFRQGLMSYYSPYILGAVAAAMGLWSAV